MVKDVTRLLEKSGAARAAMGRRRERRRRMVSTSLLLVPISGDDLWCQSLVPISWYQSPGANLLLPISGADLLVPISGAVLLVPISGANLWCRPPGSNLLTTCLLLDHCSLTHWSSSPSPRPALLTCHHQPLCQSLHPGKIIIPASRSPPTLPIRCKQILWKSWFDLLPRDNQSALAQQCIAMWHLIRLEGEIFESAHSEIWPSSILVSKVSKGMLSVSYLVDLCYRRAVFTA